LDGVNRIGDLSSVAGIFISIFGFLFTVIGVVRSKNAADRAETAAKETRDSIRLLDTVVDFSAAITALEEIKRMHREEQWAFLPDRYAHVRKLLASLRGTRVTLSNDQKITVQQAISNLRQFEALWSANLVTRLS
jgi:hypothetical protein